MDYRDILEPFERMLEQIAEPAAVRAIEAGASPETMWDEIARSGFLDALVSGEAGGFGLPAAAVQPLWQALGRYAVPLPVGETMIARMLLAEAGIEAPGGPIALAAAPPDIEIVVSLGRVARHAIVEQPGGLALVGLDAAASREEGAGADGLAGRFGWGALDSALAAPAGGLRALAALLRASLIAGACEKLVAMTAAYANERVQFGKPIGRQQALQQQMAVMAEESVAARIAAALGCAGGLPPSLAAAATAKSVASRAAVRVAATAHAVHGAIGISAEHDLQLFTRRLHEWRLADGSESYWNRMLGAVRLGDKAGSVDFVRAAFAA